MKILLGQGNPENQYTNTRHNVGFTALELIADDYSVSFIPKSKFSADIAEIVIKGEKILLVKPTTYYNQTGMSIRKIIDFYKIDTADVTVIHDDIALPLGTIRTRQKGSDAGNNGVKSLNTHLGLNYGRIRIGVANELTDKMDAADFVLSKFTLTEMQLLKSDILPKAIELARQFAVDTLPLTSYSIAQPGTKEEELPTK